MDPKTQVKAADVMRTDVAALSPDDSIERALELFEDLRIGGAPVIDGDGELVGVLALSDVLRTKSADGDGRSPTQPATYEMSEPAGEELTDEIDPDEVFFVKEDYSAETQGGAQRVGDWMTRDVISVRPDSTLAEACEVMVQQHIHRVFVTDGAKLAGILSSFDVVREIARAGRAAPARATNAHSRRRLHH